jgi:hypothetical protein
LEFGDGTAALLQRWSEISSMKDGLDDLEEKNALLPLDFLARIIPSNSWI